MLRRPTVFLLNTLVASELMPRVARAALYRALGVEIGRNCNLLAGARFHPNGHVRLGEGVFLNRRVTFDPGRSTITLGNDVIVGQDVLFAGSGHRIGGPARRGTGSTSDDITVGPGSWIGAKVTVLQGVKIAPGCIIGAGAVVTRDTQPNGVYAGVPARRTRDLVES